MNGGWWPAAAVVALLLCCVQDAKASEVNKMATRHTAHVSDKRYVMPDSMAILAKQNFNCSEERRALQRRMSALKADCKASSGIPNEELATIKQSGPTSQKGKCFLGCMMEGMNIIENGAFAAAKAERLVMTVYAEGAKRRSARKAVQSCAEEVNTTDKCETGALIFQCFQKNRVGLFGSVS